MDDCFSLEEISNHFWPQIEDGSSRETIPEGRTLHDAATAPGKLAYVILFSRANPRWDTDRIVFTKSNLDLLPRTLANGQSDAPKGNMQDNECGSVHDWQAPKDAAGTTDEAAESKKTQSPSTHTEQSSPIAVFKQVASGQSGRSFIFHGWYAIERVAFLEPKSAELVRMLEQKWTRQDHRGNVRQAKRDEAKWNESLGKRWAVVKFQKSGEAAGERGVPVIERLPDKDPESLGMPKKSVNEMLAELRMGQN